MTKTITIQNLNFEVSTPYEAGHVITDAEAKALNQTRLENIRNNMARFVKAAQTEAGEGVELSSETIASLQAKLVDYDTNYVFNLASVGGGRKLTDPVDVEAARIARTEITRQLRAAGRLVKEITPDVLANAIAQYAATPEVRKLAKENVKKRATTAQLDLSQLGI